MKKEDLFEAIGQADEPLLARSEGQKKARRWKGPVIAAACVGVVCLGGVSLLGQMGGSSGAPSHDEGAAYMFYDGPIFPLTLTEENSSVTAARNLTLDFSPYDRKEYTDFYGDTHTRYYSGLIAYDDYTLTNESDEDVTVTALYPFVGSFYDLDKENLNVPMDHFAAATVNGEEVETTLLTGSDVDGWLTTRAVLPSDGLSHDLSWEHYQTLLSDGSYQAHTLSLPTVLEETVVVYEFSDISAPAEITDLVEYYDLGVLLSNSSEYPNLKILNYNFNSLQTDDETGQRRLGSAIRSAGEDNSITTVAFLGGDMELSTVGYYRDAEHNKDVYFDGLEVTVTRTEMTLGEYLTMTIEGGFYSSTFEVQYGREGGYLSEQFCQAVMDWVEQYGTGKELMRGQTIVMLEELFSSCYHADRVYYLSFEVTIPAGESVTIGTTQYKEGSYNYNCSNGDSEDLQGYDTLTTTGSSLTFTEQTATLAGHEFIEIGRQNYGFEPENGVTTVALDLNEPWYYLEVRKAAE